jgi:hypothetical protein
LYQERRSESAAAADEETDIDDPVEVIVEE